MNSVLDFQMRERQVIDHIQWQWFRVDIIQQKKSDASTSRWRNTIKAAIATNLPAVKAVRRPKWQPFSNQFSTQMEAPTNWTAVQVCSRLVTLREICISSKGKLVEHGNCDANKLLLFWWVAGCWILDGGEQGVATKLMNKIKCHIVDNTSSH